MGLILDSSAVIAAERRGATVREFLEQTIRIAGDQEAALSSVGLTELVHGMHRARHTDLRLRRQEFLEEMLRVFTVYPFTKDTAMLAGRIDGQQQAQGVTVPFNDLLIGATALSLGFSVLTVNLRHFKLIPGLTIVSF